MNRPTPTPRRSGVRGALVEGAPTDHRLRRAGNSQMNLGLVEKDRLEARAARQSLLEAQSQRKEIVAELPDEMLAWTIWAFGHFTFGQLSREQRAMGGGEAVVRAGDRGAGAARATRSQATPHAVSLCHAATGCWPMSS